MTDIEIAQKTKLSHIKDIAKMHEIEFAKIKQKALEDLTVAEYKEFSEVVGDDVYPILQLDSILAKRDIIGGVAPRQSAIEIENLKKVLATREG